MNLDITDSTSCIDKPEADPTDILPCLAHGLWPHVAEDSCEGSLEQTSREMYLKSHEI